MVSCDSINICFIEATPFRCLFLGVPLGNLVYPYHVASQCCAAMQTRARISNQLSVVIPQFYTTITSYIPAHAPPPSPFSTILRGFDPEVDPIPIWNYVLRNGSSSSSYVSNSEYPSYS